MKFPHFNRRLHLYLSLALLPWVAMYGISSWFFAHPDAMRAHYESRPQWTKRDVSLTLPPSVSIPEPGAQPEEMRTFARAVLQAAGLNEIANSASFGAYRPNPTRVDVYVYRFRGSTSLKVDQSSRAITVEDKTFRWDHLFTGMHARGGFEQDGVLQTLWAVLVDIVSFSFLLWVATGLYMWWTLGARSAKNWGWLALIAGAASFALFMVRL